MERRKVLAGAAAGAAGILSGSASAAMPRRPVLSHRISLRPSPGSERPSRRTLTRTYVENVVVPFFLTSIYEGERPALPMIDVTLSKENALPHDLWGLIYPDWQPTLEEGVTVFLQALDKRGDNNIESGSTCPRSRLISTGPCMAPKWSHSSTSCSLPEVRRHPFYAALSRLLLEYLLGPAPRGEGGRYPAASPHHRGKLQ